MEPKLNHKHIFKLINLYRSHPILWDMNNKSYKRNDLKIKAYEIIAGRINKKYALYVQHTPGKKKNYLKKSGAGVEDKYCSTLAWYNEMRFLDSSIVIRKTMDNSSEKKMKKIKHLIKARII